jgi:sulfur carrier protein
MLKHDKRQIAAEVNLEIIEKDKYTEVMLKEGDVVEIVSFMGGGSL